MLKSQTRDVRENREIIHTHTGIEKGMTENSDREKGQEMR